MIRLLFCRIFHAGPRCRYCGLCAGCDLRYPGTCARLAGRTA